MKVTGLKELQAKMGKMVGAVKTGGKELARDVGFQGRNIAKRNAPKGIRPGSKNLKNAITFRTYTVGKSYGATIFVQSNNVNNIIAMRNEFGMEPRLYFIGEGTTETDLKKWVETKIPGHKGNYITIGGKGSRLGRTNVFWKPSYFELEKQLPKIAEKTFTRRVMRAIK